jgi:hypothetical protein
MAGGFMANGSTGRPGNGFDPGRAALATAAAVLLIGAVVLVVVSITHHQMVTVTVRGHVKTTVTGPPGPSVGLISTMLGTGFVLLLVAAYFSRIAEISSPFGGIKVTAHQAGAAARGAVRAVGNDADKVAEVVEQIAPQVAVEEYVRRQSAIARRRRARLYALAARRKPLIIPGMDDVIDTLARDAAKDMQAGDAARDMEAGDAAPPQRT